MDKAEYRSKLEQINKLAESGDFAGAAKIADEIDWRHVRSVRTLSMIGEIYEANRQYEESRKILKYAYRRSSSSKTVLYRLAELDIRSGYYDEARKFINEFEQNSPNDTSRYILKYKLLKAEKAPLDDQIAVLRNHRDAEYTERWAYELARLYKKNGQNEKCIEECDDMILWFSEGKYVQKAMELKMSLADLTPAQKEMYEEGLRRAAEQKRREEEEAAERARAAALAAEKAASEAQEMEAPAEEEIQESLGDTRDLSAIDVVEKAVLAADEDDEESRPRVSAEEAISKMDSAAAGLAADDRIETGREEASEKKHQEKVPSLIASGLKAMFSGIRPKGPKEGISRRKAASAEEAAAKAEAPGGTFEETAADAEELRAEAGAPEEKEGGALSAAHAEAADAETAVQPADAETAGAAAEEPVTAQTEEEETAAEASDRTESSPAESAAPEKRDGAEEAREEKKVRPETIDLEKLFAETGSSFASEVASGNYVMADTLEENRPSEEARIERKLAELDAEDKASEHDGEEGSGMAETSDAAAADAAGGAAAPLDAEASGDEADARQAVSDALAAEKAAAEEFAADSVPAAAKENGADDSEEEEALSLAAAIRKHAKSATERAASLFGGIGKAGRQKKEKFAGALPEEDLEIPAEEGVPSVSGGSAGLFGGHMKAAADSVRADAGAADEAPAAAHVFYEAAESVSEAGEDIYGAAETVSDAAENIAETAKDISETADDAERLYARETDESLGLTRELHLKEELDRALAERNRSEKEALAETSASAPEIISPEQAARKAVAEAQGMAASVEEEVFAAGEEAAAEVVVPREAFADEEDIPEIPAEESRESLMNLSSVDEFIDYGAATAEPEEKYEAPEFFTLIPVEGREFSPAEKSAFSYFAEIPGIDYQVTSAIADVRNNCGDKTSKSGNILIMGRMGSGKTRLAEGLIRAICLNLGLKAAREARIVADDFNRKDPAAVVKKLAGGFLIIEAAGALDEDAVSRLNQAMEFRTDDLIVILEDEKPDLMKMLGAHPDFAAKFTSTITVPVFTNDELVAFGKIYADENGFRLDEMATLALYTMISENQKDSEPVTVGMVREMMDRAIDRCSRKFRFGKPEMEDGKRVLREKDFHF